MGTQQPAQLQNPYLQDSEATHNMGVSKIRVLYLVPSIRESYYLGVYIGSPYFS